MFSYTKLKILSKPTLGMHLIRCICRTCSGLSLSDKEAAYVSTIQSLLIIGLDTKVCTLIAKIRKAVNANTTVEKVIKQSVEHQHHDY
jgi:hypothetical protein